MTTALFNLGFRVFFLLAGIFSAVSITLWALFYFSLLELTVSVISPFQWHAHEMIYGYGMAVIAGFLLTAVRNWTGLPTLQGLPLLILALCWLVARLAFSMDYLYVAFVMDSVFAVYLIVAISLPLIRVKQWKQIAVVSKILLLLLFNSLFYLGALYALDNGLTLGVYGGFYLIIGLIQMMARRVFPFFVEKACDGEVTLPNSVLLDRLLLVLFVLFFISELFLTSNVITGYVALLLFIGNSIRLCRWHVSELWSKPLLWVLYLSLWMISVGYLLFFLMLYFPVSKFIAIHAMAYGGIGLITLGMMSRVSLGHTGRSLYENRPQLTFMFSLLFFGAIVRVILPLLFPSQYLWWIGLSQLCWIVAFSTFIVFYTPILSRSRPDGNFG